MNLKTILLTAAGIIAAGVIWKALKGAAARPATGAGAANDDATDKTSRAVNYGVDLGPAGNGGGSGAY